MKVDDIDNIEDAGDFIENIQRGFEEYLAKIEEATLAMMKIAMIATMKAAGVTEVAIDDADISTYDDSQIEPSFDPETGITTFRLVEGS